MKKDMAIIMTSLKRGNSLSTDEYEELREYIGLRERQAQKASNQRKTLRMLNKVHRATIMENRWLRASMENAQGWNKTMDDARKTLFNSFRMETKVENPPVPRG